MPKTSKAKLESNRRYRKRKREAVNAQKEKRRKHVRTSNPAFRMHSDAKKRAKKRGLPFDIEMADVLVPLCCPMLGVLLELAPTKGRPHPYAPSLDRVRPELGYVKGNIRVLSFLANTMKNSATPEQLRMFAINILREHAGRMFQS